jgi:hypothetical protein
MQNTVEIADSACNTMQLSVSVNLIGNGGNWRSLDKGMIRHNSGSLERVAPTFWSDFDVFLSAGGNWGIRLDAYFGFTSANDQGTGVILQPWVIGLTPGAIEWSLV